MSQGDTEQQTRRELDAPARRVPGRTTAASQVWPSPEPALFQRPESGLGMELRARELAMTSRDWKNELGSALL